MRRLNNAEYQNTVADLFGSARPTVVFPEEGRTQGFDTLSSALAVSPIHIEAYLEAASEIVAELFDVDPAGLRDGFCDYGVADATAGLACARQIVSGFAERAWRRPLATWRDAPAEADHLALLEPSGPLGALSLETRLRTALEAVLVSARFVYRVELADDNGHLDTPSIASRLSYLLWSSAPDSELLASDLEQSAPLEAQAARMQQSARFERFLTRFPDMWLELERLAAIERDVDVYPSYSPALVAAMGDETRRFFASSFRDASATVQGLLLAPLPPASDPDLTDLYGVSPRLGLLTQASILTLTGASNRTSPVRRGKWVLERLLCDPPDPPPADLVAELSDDLANDESLSERERLALHRADPRCAGCHVVMDPVGLGLENYDSIGAYRTVDHTGEEIDASGTLEIGGDFAGPEELIRRLAEDGRVTSCVVEQLLTYGTGRTYGVTDQPLIELVALAAGGANATFRTVLSGVVQSDAFRRRD